MRNKLFMVLLGCRPEGRLTEQHDIFFGVAPDLKSLVPQMKKFWPGVSLHIDAYRCIERVGDYTISIDNIVDGDDSTGDLSLFFINLGAYMPPEFEEYHRKLLVVTDSIATAIGQAKKDSFYIDGQAFGDATRSHIDDKFEVDEIVNVNELIKDHTIRISKFAGDGLKTDETGIGYIPFSKL